jgi:hypothetical protein
MRSFVSTGEECPGGSAVFQTTFLAGPNSSGIPVEAETPDPFGPRNIGQSSARAVVEASIAPQSATDVTQTVSLRLRDFRNVFSTTLLLKKYFQSAAILTGHYRPR